MRKNIWTLITAALIVFVLGVYLVTYIVRAGHVGVVKRLGAIVAVKTNPGIYYKWPAPFQTVDDRLDVRTRVLHVTGGEMQTRERFNVLVHLAVGWRIRRNEKDVKRFYETLQGSVNQAQTKLRDRIRSVRKGVVNGTELGALLSTDPTQKAVFAKLENDIKDSVQKSLDKAEYGIELDFVSVQSIKFPAPTTEKILDRMNKERKRASQKFLVEGDNEAEMIKNNAKQEAQKLLTEAKAKADVMRGQAEAEASKYFAAFKENIELFKWLKRVEAYEAALKNKSTTIILRAKSDFDLLIPEPPKQK